MNVLVLSSSPRLVSVVQALLRARVARPNVFRIDGFEELSHLLSYAACDMVFIDAKLAGRDPAADATRLRALFPELSVVVVAAGDVATAEGTRVDPLLEALRLIAPDAVAVEPISPPSTAPALTVRQLEVLRLLRQGHRTREIAVALAVTVPTVKSHLRALYRFLGARNRLEAVVMAESGARARPTALLRVVA